MNKTATFSSNSYMNIKNALGILILIVSCAGGVRGSDPGTTAANFLKLGVGHARLLWGMHKSGWPMMCMRRIGTRGIGPLGSPGSGLCS